MTSPDTPRHVELRDGDKMVAAAEVTTAAGPEGTARTSLHAAAGQLGRLGVTDAGEPAR